LSMCNILFKAQLTFDDTWIPCICYLQLIL
jgi:hypothetical protein